VVAENSSCIGASLALYTKNVRIVWTHKPPRLLVYAMLVGVLVCILAFQPVLINCAHRLYEKLPRYEVPLEANGIQSFISKCTGEFGGDKWHTG